jgi:hypothetical protein
LHLPPQHGAQPRGELSQRERLDQVVVSASVQAGDPVGQPSACGEHHDPQVTAGVAFDAAVADALGQGEAVAIRQVDVQQQHVVLGDDQLLASLRAGQRRIDGVAVTGQTGLQRTDQPLLVLHEQHPHARKR